MDKEFEFNKELSCHLSTTQESTASATLSQDLNQPETRQRKQLPAGADLTRTRPSCSLVQLPIPKRQKKWKKMCSCSLARGSNTAGMCFQARDPETACRLQQEHVTTRACSGM